MIRGEIIPHKDLHTIMYKLKKQNNKKYKGKIKALYADYAYDKCYKKTRKRQKGGHHELVILGATALAKWWDNSKKKLGKIKKEVVENLKVHVIRIVIQEKNPVQNVVLICPLMKKEDIELQMKKTN